MTDTELIIHARRKPSILWTDGQAAAVLHPSTNRKTGAPFSIAFYAIGHDPGDITTIGAGCTACALNGAGCYAQYGPESLTHTRRAGALADFPHLPRRLWHQVFGGIFVRIGSYGDPGSAPARLIRAICQTSGGWTGYTHQWRDLAAFDYAPYLMASCETLADVRSARAAGWRVFAIVSAGSHRHQERNRNDTRRKLHSVARELGERVHICPHWTSQGRTQCAKCPTPCNGNTDGRSIDILIPAHGTRAKTATGILPILLS